MPKADTPSRGEGATCSYTMHICRKCGDMEYCGRPGTWHYPAMGGGMAYLCDEHATGLRDHAEAISMTRLPDV